MFSTIYRIRKTSLSLRGFPKFGTSKTLNLNGLAFFMPNVPKLSDFLWEHLGSILGTF